jgi:hypothetical protein
MTIVSQMQRTIAPRTSLPCPNNKDGEEKVGGKSVEL